MNETKRDSHANWKNLKNSKKTVSLRRELFNEKSITEDAKNIIENFDKILESVSRLSGKQKVSLPGAIKNLSHQLTDERGARRLGYMNEASFLSAYTNYFMWWNLVRLCRLFANLPKSAFSFGDAAVALDIGSGPLTIPTALWLARPELRSKKITWYCLDLSSGALSLGEEIYLSVAAKTIAASSSESPENKSSKDLLEPWKIIRVKGALGTQIKEKADFITCANAFNEIVQRNEMPTDFLAKKYSDQLSSYLAPLSDEKANAEDKNQKQTILLVEPGDPHSARFVSLMRGAFLRRGFEPLAPCTHTEECPMSGRTGGRATNSAGRNAKWCNFAFSTDSAPKNLLRLSEKAGIPKERASLSFILLSRASEQDFRKSGRSEEFQKNNDKSGKTFIRITSDFIKLPEIHKSGYYACSKFGLLLAVDENHVQPKNGELLQIKTPDFLDGRDEKSGALIVKI